MRAAAALVRGVEEDAAWRRCEAPAELALELGCWVMADLEKLAASRGESAAAVASAVVTAAVRVAVAMSSDAYRGSYEGAADRRRQRRRAVDAAWVDVGAALEATS